MRIQQNPVVNWGERTFSAKTKGQAKPVFLFWLWGVLWTRSGKRGGSQRAPPGADTASWLSWSGRIFSAQWPTKPKENSGTAKSNPSFSAKKKRQFSSEDCRFFFVLFTFLFSFFSLLLNCRFQRKDKREKRREKVALLHKALYYHSFVSSNLYDLDIYFVLRGFEPEAVGFLRRSARRRRTKIRAPRNPIPTSAKTKGQALPVFLFLAEWSTPDGVWKMKSPSAMKRAFGTLGTKNVLRFMQALASASYWRSQCFISPQAMHHLKTYKATPWFCRKSVV